MTDDNAGMTSDELTIEINGVLVTASMDTWEAVNQAITARQVADRKAWEQAQREAGQVWYAVYSRYHHSREDEFFLLREAAGFLVAGMEDGDLYAESIRCPDGSVIKGDYETLTRLLAAASPTETETP